MSTIEDRKRALEALLASGGAGLNQTPGNWQYTVQALSRPDDPRVASTQSMWDDYLASTAAGRRLDDYGLALATQNWFAQLDKAKQAGGGGGGGGRRSGGSARAATQYATLPAPSNPYADLWDQLGVGDYTPAPSYTPSVGVPSNQSGKGYSTAGAGLKPKPRRPVYAGGALS